MCQSKAAPGIQLQWPANRFIVGRVNQKSGAVQNWLIRVVANETSDTETIRVRLTAIRA